MKVNQTGEADYTQNVLDSQSEGGSVTDKAEGDQEAHRARATVDENVHWLQDAVGESPAKKRLLRHAANVGGGIGAMGRAATSGDISAFVNETADTIHSVIDAFKDAEALGTAPEMAKDVCAHLGKIANGLKAAWMGGQTDGSAPENVGKFVGHAAKAIGLAAAGQPLAAWPDAAKAVEVLVKMMWDPDQRAQLGGVNKEIEDFASHVEARYRKNNAGRAPQAAAHGHPLGV
ncbi:hypothetical protein LJR230_002196 [Trinickia sp. LjRoot230]|uniref:hypothetical protein n=1 Tax=Trinickia sp. LjRoot230 TaxID=3342288 RepID=UPI003ECDADF9